MAIQTNCPGCGKQYNLKDEMAGKKIRCPECKGVIVVPAGGASAGAPARPAPQPSPAAPAQARRSTVKMQAPRRPVSGTPTSEIPNLKKELPPKKLVTASTCPGCGKAIKENAVTCAACGYNIKLGRKMSISNAIKDASREKGVRADGSRYMTREEKAEQRVESGKKMRLGMIITAAVFLIIVTVVLLAVFNGAWWGEDLATRRVNAGVIPQKINDSGVLVRDGGWFHPWCVNMNVRITVDKSAIVFEKPDLSAVRKGDASSTMFAEAARLPMGVKGNYPESLMRRVLFDAFPNYPDEYDYTPGKIQAGPVLDADGLAFVRYAKLPAENGYLNGFLLDPGVGMSAIKDALKERGEKVEISGVLYFIASRKDLLNQAPDTYGYALGKQLDRIPPLEEGKGAQVEKTAATADAGKKKEEAVEPEDASDPRFYFHPVVFVKEIKTVR
ncbi:MAG: hypothetical protein JXR97_17380 [Planctomycetes bacterium]|nr:hypothetical protein [Planctomycetota bacterium]